MGVIGVGASPSGAFGGPVGERMPFSRIRHRPPILQKSVLKGPSPFLSAHCWVVADAASHYTPQSVSLAVFERKRDVAQPGSAPEWGSGGRGFKSRRPDCCKSLSSADFSRKALP